MDAVVLGGRDILAVDETRAGVNFARIVSEICNRIHVRHLLAYGDGGSWLFRHLKVNHPMRLQSFNRVETTDPVPAQMVACIDVFGYDETEKAFQDMVRLTEAVLFANIKVTEEQPLIWWLEKFCKDFDVHTVQVTTASEFFVICYAKPRLEAVSGEKL